MAFRKSGELLIKTALIDYKKVLDLSLVLSINKDFMLKWIKVLYFNLIQLSLKHHRGEEMFFGVNNKTL